jgi:hypothetical protein
MAAIRRRKPTIGDNINDPKKYPQNPKRNLEPHRAMIKLPRNHAAIIR